MRTQPRDVVEDAECTRSEFYTNDTLLDRPFFTSAESVVKDAGSRVNIAHAHQCCIFQSYVKTVPSRMKLTMKLTMREPASMTADT